MVHLWLGLIGAKKASVVTEEEKEEKLEEKALKTITEKDDIEVRQQSDLTSRQLQIGK